MSLNDLTSTIHARLPYLGLVGMILLLDRWSKSVIQNKFSLGDNMTVVDSFFELTYVRNTGIAFGIFSSVNSPAKATVLSVFAAVAAVVIIVYSVRSPLGHSLLQIALALILGGTLGNLYDRVTYSYVIDFIHLHVGSYYWPAFNLADAAISVGVVFLAVEIIRDEIAART